MSLLQDELKEVKSLCERTITGSRLVSCVETMVRVEIKKSYFKTVVICLQFPPAYPVTPLLMEMKSKTLSDKLLDRLTCISDTEIKKYLGKPQILRLLKFIDQFMMENPLCCCYAEITNLKTLLTDNDELKLRQKSSSIFLKVTDKLYYLQARILVPDIYPEKSVR